MTAASVEWNWLAATLAELGVGDHRWVRLESVGAASIAWPDVKVALALSSDPASGLTKAGWSVHPLPKVGSLQTFCDVVSGAASDVKRSRNLPASSVSWWEMVRRTLTAAGAPDSTWYKSSLGAVSVAWPQSQVGLALPDDPYVGLSRSGWMIHRLMPAATLSAHVEQIFEASYDVVVRRSGVSAKNPSKVEQQFARMLLAAGLPEAVRDMEVRDPVTGALRTIPDFVWPEAKLVCELDGFHIHQGVDLDAMLKTASESKKREGQMRKAKKFKAEQDASKRNLLAALGWTVMVVIDEQVYRGKGPEEAAKVRAAYDGRVATSL